MKTFQKPLSAEEEMYFFQILKDGDETQKKRARDVLIERNLRLVAHIAGKYQAEGVEQEDMISIGTIGLIKAVDTFDYEKGSRLATYAVRCIENELLMMFRSRKKLCREVSLYEPVGADKEGNEIRLLDVIEQEHEDPIRRLEHEERMQSLPVFLERLPDREREIIRLRYGIEKEKEYTQREIGELLNISRSYVSRIEKRAIGKLRKYYKNASKTNGGLHNAIRKSTGVENRNETCQTDL